MKYFAPGCRAFITSSSSSTTPKASSTSLSVTGQLAPDINGSVINGAESDRPGIRNTMMLQIASGISSSGNIGEAFLQARKRGGHTTLRQCLM